MVEDAWNSRDPANVALAYTVVDTVPPGDFADDSTFRLALGHDLELLRGGSVAAALD